MRFNKTWSCYIQSNRKGDGIFFNCRKCFTYSSLPKVICNLCNMDFVAFNSQINENKKDSYNLNVLIFIGIYSL